MGGLIKVSGLYNAELSAGALLLKESREIARLMLRGADKEVWHRALVIDNVLQKKTPSTSKRMAALIRKRLELMGHEHWRLVADGSNEVALHALLAAAIKHSHLLGDFMYDVVRERVKTYDNKMSIRDWEKFLDECEHRDGTVSHWSSTTKQKLGQVIFKILSQAKYIDNTRSRTIIPVQINPVVQRLLVDTNEKYVLKCMEVFK